MADDLTYTYHDLVLDTGAHGNPVVFLHPKDTGGVLVELEETTNF
jgi:hypothetical protein